MILEADAVAPSDEPTPARVDIRLTPSSDTPESNDDARETGEVMPAIVADATFTEVLLAQVPHDSVAPDLAARQLALAYSAVVARQDGGATPVAAVADRESAAELTTSETLALGDRLTALSQAPWVELVDAAEMLDGEASAQVGLSSQDSPTYPAAQLVVTETLRLDAVVAGLASAFDSDAEFLALRSSLTIAPSAAWRDAGTNGSLVTQRVSARVEELSDAIVVSPPESNVNLFAEESAIPVVVTNTLDVPVTVRVQLIPEHPALRIEGAPDVRLEAGAAQTVRIPVTALANGTTTVDVVVASPDGVRLGPPSTFQMTVRAEWESVTTGVLAAALGVLLVIGLVRNIRRGRRGDDGLPPPAAPDRVKERAS